MKHTNVKMLQGRALYELMQNEFVDIIWSMTSIEREKKLTPIRIPLYKGLIGSRLLLINTKDKSKFRDIHSKKDLLQFYAGQGHDWPDTYILKNNDLPVVTSANYEGLFGMLLLDRFDYFPRSIIEIWDEAQAHISDEIIVEPNLIIQYPTASYFFVNKKIQKVI